LCSTASSGIYWNPGVGRGILRGVSGSLGNRTPVSGDEGPEIPKKPRKTLTDTAIRKTKKGAKPFKLFDERGLFLLVTPAGGKLWRLKYRFAGKEKLLALGSYPDVSLADARDRRDEARKRIASGVDPSAERRAKRAAAGDTFEAVSREWFEKFSKQWAPSHSRTVSARMKLHLWPFIGALPIADIEAPELLVTLRRLESAGHGETARRLRQIASHVFCYAIAKGIARRDPAADLRRALAPVESKVRAAIINSAEGATPKNLKEVGALLRALDGYDGSIIVRCALRLAPLVFVRPGELRKAEWSEIDFDRGLWLIPASRMKMRQALVVPLSTQSVAILRELHPVTGHGRFVFPSARSVHRPMSDNAVLAALRRSGIAKDEMSGHGFRAIARTLLDEVLGVRVDLIEHQLGHAVKDPNGRAYNRTAFVTERVTMMQQWADYLQNLKVSQ
jgi:integrase